MVGNKKELSVARVLGLLSFIEAGCALLFSPVVFGIRGVVMGICVYCLGEKKWGVWGIVSSVVCAFLGFFLSLYLSSLSV